MRTLQLVACLAFFGVACGVIGAVAVLDAGGPAWLGLTIGGAFGLAVGSIFAGRGAWLPGLGRVLFGPPDEDDGEAVT